jgi:hypothetical protein
MSKSEDQVYLKHGKGDRSIKEPKQKRLEPKSRSRKNWMFRFWILDVSVFSEQIESE